MKMFHMLIYQSNFDLMYKIIFYITKKKKKCTQLGSASAVLFHSEHNLWP